MAGLLTPPSTGGDAAPAPQARPAPPPLAPPAQPNTLSPGNLLAGATGVQPASTPPVHSNEAINAALMQAFHPIVPDQINSLLGPAMGHIMGGAPPIAYYQPRPAGQVPTVRST